MGTRDRPHREAKKKPKDASAKKGVQPFLEPPTNVEVIKPRRKPRTVVEESQAEEEET
jgi:hypothetical protein